MKEVVLDFDKNEISVTDESFKSLRANIQFCGKNIHTIAVTSCLPNDGKSTISINLSRALALAGKKVLFVDADLRKSIIVKKYVDTSGIIGLSELLSGQAELDDVKYRTQIENFDIIFSGQYPANPAELLSSVAFEEFLATVKGEYDYIIIDTPPLGVVIDAAIVAGDCDGTVLVISEGRIKASFAKGVMNQLEKSGAHILGAVINENEKTKSNRVNYGKYYKYYGKYYSKYSYKYSYTNDDDKK